MRSIPACRLLLIGMSIRRNLPPIGTAGLARYLVSGQSRVPWPPPRIAVMTFRMTASLRALTLCRPSYRLHARRERAKKRSGQGDEIGLLPHDWGIESDLVELEPAEE